VAIGEVALSLPSLEHGLHEGSARGSARHLHEWAAAPRQFGNRCDAWETGTQVGSDLPSRLATAAGEEGSAYPLTRQADDWFASGSVK
jgi:hypothetical protein